MFCAPSAGSVARINALPASPWGAVMDVCPQSTNPRAGWSFIKITGAETSMHRKGKRWFGPGNLLCIQWSGQVLLTEIEL